MLRVWSIVSALPLLATAAAAKVTYDDHVLPVFQQACMNCHNPDRSRGGLDLSSYTATLKGGSGGVIVEAGDPGSKLVALVRHTAEPKMPPEGDPLSREQIDVLTGWIEGGLLENESSSARKPARPKFSAVVPSDPAARPGGPPPMPEHLVLEPVVVTPRGSAVHAIAASPWAPLVAITGQRQVLLHHAESLELVGILPFPEGDPVALAFTPDARHLVVGGGVPGKSGTTVTFEVTTGSRIVEAGREFDSVLAADIRPGFDLVATGGPSRLLNLWDTTTGERTHSIRKHTDWITALDISPDGILLASGDRNGGLWVWEAGGGAEFHTLRAHLAAITSLAFRADSNLLASASEDGTLRFWEMNGGSEVRKIDAHPGGVTAFSFARDGSSLSAGRDRSAKLWKPDFSPLRQLAKDLSALPTAAALDHPAARAFIGDADGLVHVFATADGKSLGTIPTNPPTIAARLEHLRAQLADADDPAPLHHAIARWSAAAINSQRLATEQHAALAFDRLDHSHDQFAATADQIRAQAERLRQKRSERQTLAAAEAPADPAHQAELAATLAAINIVIEREIEALRALENQLIDHRRTIPPTAREAWQQQLAARRLHAEYTRAATEATP